MCPFRNNYPIVTRGSHVSRALPHHIPPRFSKSSWYLFCESITMNLNRTKMKSESGRCASKRCWPPRQKQQGFFNNL